jgi:hypothetical protein
MPRLKEHKSMKIALVTGGNRGAVVLAVDMGKGKSIHT